MSNFVKGLRYIPPLPAVLAKIMQLLGDERTTVAELEELISHDQALTSKVLSIANSAYWGLRSEVVSIERATVLLGFDEIQNICLGAGLIGFMHPSIFRNREGAEQLWLHTLAVAEGTQIIGKYTSFIESGSAFTAGLIHDLGKAVLAAFFPSELDDVIRLMESENLSYRQAEIASGTDHAAIGQELAQLWGLPTIFADVTGGHHEPNIHEDIDPLVAAVHVADFLARELAIGESGNPDRPTFDTDVVRWLGLTASDIREIRKSLIWRKPAIEDFWLEMIR